MLTLGGARGGAAPLCTAVDMEAAIDTVCFSCTSETNGNWHADGAPKRLDTQLLTRTLDWREASRALVGERLRNLRVPDLETD